MNSFMNYMNLYTNKHDMVMMVIRMFQIWLSGFFRMMMQTSALALLLLRSGCELLSQCGCPGWLL